MRLTWYSHKLLEALGVLSSPVPRYSQGMKEEHIRSYMVFLKDEEFVMVLPLEV